MPRTDLENACSGVPAKQPPSHFGKGCCAWGDFPSCPLLATALLVVFFFVISWKSSFLYAARHLCTARYVEFLLKCIKEGCAHLAFGSISGLLHQPVSALVPSRRCLHFSTERRSFADIVVTVNDHGQSDGLQQEKLSICVLLYNLVEVGGSLISGRKYTKVTCSLCGRFSRGMHFSRCP